MSKLIAFLLIAVPSAGLADEAAGIRVGLRIERVGRCEASTCLRIVEGRFYAGREKASKKEAERCAAFYVRFVTFGTFDETRHRRCLAAGRTPLIVNQKKHLPYRPDPRQMKG